MLLDGNRAGEAVEQDKMRPTTLAHGFPEPLLLVPAPPPWTKVFRQDAGSDELQQLLGSRSIWGQVPEVAGNPLQNCEAQFSVQVNISIRRIRKVGGCYIPPVTPAKSQVFSAC